MRSPLSGDTRKTSTDAPVAIGRYAKDLHRCARHRTIGLNTAGRARYQPAQPDFRLWRNRDPIRFAAGNEFIDLAEGARMIRRLTMVDRAKYDIGRALESWSLEADAGRRAGLAENVAIGLRVFIHVVAAQRQERRARRHFALAVIEGPQEG